MLIVLTAGVESRIVNLVITVTGLLLSSAACKPIIALRNEKIRRGGFAHTVQSLPRRFG